MPDSSSGVKKPTSRYNKINSQEHDPERIPTPPSESPPLPSDLMPPPPTSQLMPPPPTSQLMPPPPPPKPKASPSVPAPLPPLESEPKQLPSPKAPPTAMPGKNNETMFKDQLNSKISTELKNNKQVVLYFDKIIGYSLHQFLSDLCNHQNKIKVNLPMITRKASIVIHSGADQNVVEKLIDKLAETEFIPNNGVGCCYIVSCGNRYNYDFPNQRPASPVSSGQSSTIQSATTGKTNAGALSSLLNSRLNK
jgi:hypothetical protein